MSLKQFPFSLWLSILPLAHGSESSIALARKIDPDFVDKQEAAH
jgi:hypothetical protein